MKKCRKKWTDSIFFLLGRTFDVAAVIVIHFIVVALDNFLCSRIGRRKKIGIFLTDYVIVFYDMTIAIAIVP